MEILEQFRTLLNEKNYSKLRELAEEMNVQDVALVLDEMEDEDMLKMFRIFPKELAADVFAELEVESQQYIITSLSEKEAGIIIDNLYADDATDLLEEMPANVVKKILANAKPETRKDINHLLQYPEDSAGSIMTVEFVDLHINMTVEDAIQRIREYGSDSESIETLYVLNPKRVLLGTVGLRQLILGNKEDRIEDIMHEEFISCTTSMDQELVSQLFMKYDLVQLPVVDKENRMVGIITVDDVIDIIQEEATEDIDKMAGIIPGDKAYLKTSVFETWKKRIPWLLLLMISATFTGGIIKGFEDALSKYIVLTAYIPMLMDTGGNSGNQASAEVVRSLSLGQISFADFTKVIWKEIRVGVLCGLTLSVANFAKCILIDRLEYGVALVICLTILLAVFIAKLFASMLVMLIDRVHLDPAVVASPMLTTAIDAVSLLIYFSIATMLLGI